MFEKTGVAGHRKIGSTTANSGCVRRSSENEVKEGIYYCEDEGTSLFDEDGRGIERQPKQNEGGDVSYIGKGIIRVYII